MEAGLLVIQDRNHKAKVKPVIPGIAANSMRSQVKNVSLTHIFLNVFAIDPHPQRSGMGRDSEFAVGTEANNNLGNTINISRIEI